MSRVASRYDWHAVRPPSPLAGQATRYYVANPTPALALNAWRASGWWRWGILGFVDGSMLVFRDGGAPTLAEAKLRAESALPEAAHPQLRTAWGGRLPMTDPIHESDLPF
jgi:hypothetical protein